MKKLVKELSGAELDYWVAKAEGCTFKPSVIMDNQLLYATAERPTEWLWLDMFRPSTDWNWGGPIIDRMGIFLEPSNYPDEGVVYAYFSQDGFGQWGPDRLTAAMRLVVFKAFGEEVGDEVAA